jgi:hypothetical protein
MTPGAITEAVQILCDGQTVVATFHGVGAVRVTFERAAAQER